VEESKGAGAAFTVDVNEAEEAGVEGVCPKKNGRARKSAM